MRTDVPSCVTRGRAASVSVALDPLYSLSLPLIGRIKPKWCYTVHSHALQCTLPIGASSSPPSVGHTRELGGLRTAVSATRSYPLSLYLLCSPVLFFCLTRKLDTHYLIVFGLYFNFTYKISLQTCYLNTLTTCPSNIPHYFPRSTSDKFGCLVNHREMFSRPLQLPLLTMWNNGLERKKGGRMGEGTDMKEI